MALSLPFSPLPQLRHILYPLPTSVLPHLLETPGPRTLGEKLHANSWDGRLDHSGEVILLSGTGSSQAQPLFLLMGTAEVLKMVAVLLGGAVNSEWVHITFS